MEQLIYIEQNDKNEALMLTRGFTLDEIRTRAYVNALGVELAMKYLAQENICVSNIYNIHNINKIRENFDIADIMLPNIHIDVRVVYDENVIFIPKSHFEYNLVPDIYLVFKMAEESTHVEFLGFFEPKLINKNNQNSDYYFIEKEKLSYASDLKNYIENFHGNTTNSLTETEMETAQRMAISLIDDDLAINDKKTLLELLTKSSSLREKLIEYDNFEWISFHTTKGVDLEDIDNLKNSDILTTSNEITNPDEFEFFEQKDEFEQFESEKDVDAHEEETLAPAEDESFEMNMEEDTLASAEDESFEMNMEEEVPLEDVVIEEDALLASLEDEIDTAETTLSVPNDEELFTTNDLSDVEIDIVEDEVKEEITNTEDILLETDNENSSLSELSQPNSVEDITEISENINLSENALIENMIEDEVKDTPHSKEVTEEMISEVLAQSESTGSMSLDALSTIYDVNYENNEEYSNTETMASLEQLATFFNMEEENTISETTNKEKDKVQDIPVIPNKTPQKLNVYENSTIISNENMIIGEIFIDINQMVANENYEINTSTKSSNKNVPKVLVAVGMIIAVLAGWYFFSDFNNKPQEQIPENTPQNPVENNLNEEIDGNIFGEPAEQETMENIEKIIPADKIQFDEVIKETKKEVSKPSKTPPALSPYLEVNSLSWSVPDYLSYNENFKNYLQTTGKSLKLSMSSDLLLVTEYAYSNIIHVTITLAPTGTLQNAQITKSSGSEQIDKIVLRTVNETLNVLKAPSGLIVGDGAKLVLKINL